MSQLSVIRTLKCSDFGFTLVELLVTVAVVAILAAVSVPAFSALYSRCCLTSMASQFTGLLREARQRSLQGDYHAIIFDSAAQSARLVSGRGADDQWNTGDDPVVRQVSLPPCVRFGHGSCGPLPTLAVAADGVSFQNNILVCNPELTGNAGTVYLITPSGNAMALSVNSADLYCKLYRWSGSSWKQL